MVVTAPLVNEALDPTVAQYFDAFNQEDYAAVAALFEAQGILCPPFEAGLVGPSAIAQYLGDEARECELRWQRSQANPSPVDSAR